MFSGSTPLEKRIYLLICNYFELNSAASAITYINVRNHGTVLSLHQFCCAGVIVQISSANLTIVC